jgi:hypothetical protein
MSKVLIGNFYWEIKHYFCHHDLAFRLTVMKILICFLFVSSLVCARSVVPSRIVTSSLDIFSSKNKILPNGDVQVQVTGNTEEDYFEKNASTKILKSAEFISFQKLARGVFKTDFADTNKVDKFIGTVFSIGNNLILTNHHVLDPSYMNFSRCDGLQVKDHSGVTFSCRKVHYCNAKEDFCLIEMATQSVPIRRCIFCFRVPTREVSLGEQDALKLKANYSLNEDKAATVVLTAIGNSENLGIHVSQGKGAVVKQDYIQFWAPSTTGNSGGPLLNEAGLVVGIVKNQSYEQGGSYVSENYKITYNGAVNINYAIGLIREALKDRPETLRNFNQAVVE